MKHTKNNDEYFKPSLLNFYQFLVMNRMSEISSPMHAPTTKSVLICFPRFGHDTIYCIIIIIIKLQLSIKILVFELKCSHFKLVSLCTGISTWSDPQINVCKTIKKVIYDDLL